ncbi:hypothetical protein [Sporosarcina sp. NPDC096371]|uniref:hypothetical protein n=1 Tax=Sporosarcina sp. NPDC096371 TaxID=3364530 RepID=UPI003827A1DB
MIVQVKDIPIRHNHQSYKVGEEFEIDDNDFNESLFVKIADSKKEPKKPKNKEKGSGD